MIETSDTGFKIKIKQYALMIVALAERHPWLMAIFGFGSGVFSFVMVERKQGFAQIIAIMMLVSWLWLALENVLQRGVSHWFGFTLPPALMRYVTQMVHQESLFFVIPFLFVTTVWSSGQVVFTSIIMIAALISVLDPIYYHWLAPRRCLYFIYHGITLFVVLITALPIILHLPTPKSYLCALIIAVVLSLPSIAREMTVSWWKRGVVMVLLIAIVSSLGLLARPWVPPSSLWLAEVAITEHINNENRSPENKLNEVTVAQLQTGLYAYTSIHAPRGLNERIYHVWLHNGKSVDRVALDINGGREAGYRAWTHKVNFPADSLGNWQIQVVTEANQLIGALRFEVVDVITNDQSLPEYSLPNQMPQEKLLHEQPSQEQPSQEQSSQEQSSEEQSSQKVPSQTPLTQDSVQEPSQDYSLESQSLQDQTKSAE